MKTKKIFLVAFLLLAVLTIGAVSASESADDLAVEDAGELSIDEAHADVVANDGEQEITRDNIQINVDPDYQYSLDENNQDEENHFTVEAPSYANGTIIISSNGQDFNKELKDFNDTNSWTDENNISRYTICPKDVDFFSGLETNDLVAFKFVVDDNIINSRLFVINFEAEGFKLQDVDDNLHLNFWDNNQPLYVDSQDGVFSIDVNEDGPNGIYFISANGIEYKYVPNYDENGWAWHEWVLSSFNIAGPGIYPITVKNGKDKDSASVIAQDQLNVTVFNNDAFRVYVSKANSKVSVYCPDGSEGAKISVFLKDDGDDEIPFNLAKTYDVSSEDYDTLINFTFNDLGMMVEEDYDLKVTVANSTGDEIFDSGSFGVWYDEYYEESPEINELTLSINNDNFAEESGDNWVIELYIPEKSLISEGIFNITSNSGVLITDPLNVWELEFNDEGRYYKYCILYEDLKSELGDLSSGDILTAVFADSENNSNNITKSFFYIHVVDEGDEDEEPEEHDKFTMVNFKDANLLMDGVIIEICDFPENVDDEFKIVVDKWGDESTYNFKISELTRNEEGIYVFKCSDFNYAEWMWDMSDVDYEVFVRFTRGGEEADEFNENPKVYKNPEMHHGEITKDAEWGSVIYFKDIEELRNTFNDEFIVNVTKNGVVIYNLTIDLTEIYDKYAHEDEEGETGYWMELTDLNITQNGDYGIVMEFTIKGSDEKVQFNSTISVVDYVIDARSNVKQINDPVFRILLEKKDSGTVAIYVNRTKVFDGTLAEIGFSDWNRMGGYNIPLNYLNITQSGKYEIILEVNSTKGNRTVTLPIELVVGENTFDFKDIIYGYAEGGFVIANLTSPIPKDSEFVLYLNGKEAGRTTIYSHEFEFRNLDKSFTDEFNNLKAGSYEAIIELVSNGQSIQNYTGSFKVWDKNGTVTVSVPGTFLTIDDAYISFSANMPDIRDKGPLALIIYIDPFLEDDGWFNWDHENMLEFRGEDLEELLDGKTHKVSLKRSLSAGTHKLFVVYVYDEWEQYMNHDFFTGLFTVNVQKTATKLSGSAVKATYDVAKNLVITLRDANNNILVGKKVSIKVGSISKTLTTNKKGQIVVDISKLVPKTYAATVKFAGDGTYKASSLTVKKIVVNKAKPKFTTKKVKVKAKTKTKKIKITLKHNKKAVKGKQITLKIKGKTYKAKTNKKGVATFKVKKLSKGKFTGKLKFKGDKYYKGISGKVKVIVK